MTEQPIRTGDPRAGNENAQVRDGRNILRCLHGAIKAAMIYEANNQAYRARASELSGWLGNYLTRYKGLRIDYFNDFFFVDGVRLKYGHPDFSQDRELAALFDELQLGRLEFASVPEAEKLDRAVFALAHLDRKTDDPFETLQETWAELNLASIRLGRAAPQIAQRLSPDEEARMDRVQRRQRAGRIFFRTTDLLRDFTHRFERATAVNSGKAQRVIHDLIDHIVRDEVSLLEFATIKDFDDYTYGHSTNVCIYAIALGLRLGLDKRRLSQLGYAALFHDIGKVKLPQELISKPDVYDEHDWQAMRRHPILGALTLAAMPTADEHNARALIVAYEHHIGLDGSGYPSLPTSRDLNLFSRIVAVADAYDAMTSGRVYIKTRISPDEAVLRLMRQAGMRYDSLILRAFVHALGVFPIGTMVRLSDGEIAVVIDNNPEDLYRPDVQIVHGADQTPVPEERIVRLSERDPDSGAYPIHIDEILDPDDQGIAIGDILGITPEAFADAPPKLSAP